MDGIHEGDLHVREDGTFVGRVGGSCFVAEGVTFQLTGVIEGDLVLETGSRVGVTGAVFGGVTIHDAELQVVGEARGELEVNGGSIVISPGLEEDED